MITALGTGVLVGTALIVIIPEGVETLYKASEGTHSHGTRDVGMLGSKAVTLRAHGFDLRRDEPWTHDVVFEYDPDPSFRTGPDDGWEDGKKDDEPFPDFDDTPAKGGSPSKNQSDASDRDPHVWVGFALISGFILMYLIDTLPQQTGATFAQQPQRFAISLNQFSFNRLRASSGSLAEDEPLDEAENTSGSNRNLDSRSNSTTLGLVIHAAADGIALGASSASSGSGKRNLSFIIFIALMLHKAPAAFGLTSVLLKQGLSKRLARAHLVIFSLAAPIGALVTWAAVHILGYAGSADSPEGEFATGILLLFSGGTFLYVAVHTMQDSTKSGHRHGDENGFSNIENPYAPSSGSSSKGSAGNTGLVDVLVTVGGMLLPLLTQWGH